MSAATDPRMSAATDPRMSAANHARPRRDDLTLVRSRMVETALEYRGLDAPPAAVAAAYGLPLTRYEALGRQLDEAVAAAAARLLEEPDVRAALDALPLRPGATVLAAGDSITADRLSWSRLLAALLRARRPDDEIRVLASANSGDTTTEALRRLARTLPSAKPDRVLALLGANDALGQGPAAIPLVSDRETERNLAVIAELVDVAGAQLAWIAPLPAIPERAADDRWLAARAASVSTERLAAKRALVLARSEPVLDATAAFGSPPDPDLFSDGVHPSLAGHERLARCVVAQLARV